MPLPTYQQFGLLSQPTQRLDFASEREAERSSQILSQSLDRLSDFAFKRAAYEAQIKGRQWAVENPVVPEQIKEAQENGKDLSTFIPPAGTYFGDEARRITAYQLRASLETSARMQMAGITENIELGKITSLKQVQDEMYGIINGGGKVISAVDPEVAASFKASVSVAGNSVFQYAAKKIHELEVAASKYDATKLIDAAPKNISLIIQSTYDPAELKKKLDNEERRVSDALYLTRDPAFYEKGMEQFNKNVLDSKVAVLTEYMSSKDYADSEVAAINRLRKNDGGKYVSIWASIDDKTKIEIRSKIQKQYIEISEANNRERLVLEQQNQKEFVGLYADWVKANPKEKKELETKMIPLAPSTAELDKILKVDGEGQKGDPLIYSRLRDDVANGVYTDIYQLHPYYSRRAINQEQLSSLQTLMMSENRKEEGAAIRRLNRFSGVGDTVTGAFDPEAAQFKKQEKLIKRFDAAVIEEKKRQQTLPPEKRTGINYNAIADSVMDNYRNVDMKDDRKVTAKKSLESISSRASKDYGRTIVITESSSIEELRKLEGKKQGNVFSSRIFNDDDLASIQKQINILKE